MDMDEVNFSSRSGTNRRKESINMKDNIDRLNSLKADYRKKYNYNAFASNEAPSHMIGKTSN